MKENDKNFILTCVTYIIAMLLLLAIHLAMGLGWMDGLSDEVIEIGFSIVSQIVIMAGVPFVVFALYKKKQSASNALITELQEPPTKISADFGLRKISFKFVLLAFVLGIILYILTVFVAGFFANLLDGMGYQHYSSDNVFHGWEGLFISLVFTAVLPGFCEEYLHRGMLLSGFVKKFGVYRAILLVSLIFGLMHMNVAQFFYTAALGWFFATAVLASRSLWVGVIMHFTNNAISVYMMYSEELGLYGSEIVQTLFSNGLLIILVLILAVVGMGEILRYMGRVNFEKNKGAYTARYLTANNNRFTAEDFEQVSNALDSAIKKMSTWGAVSAYIETHEKPQKMTPLERAVFVSMLVLGGIITVFSFYWGTL